MFVEFFFCWVIYLFYVLEFVLGEVCSFMNIIGSLILCVFFISELIFEMVGVNCDMFILYWFNKFLGFVKLCWIFMMYKVECLVFSYVGFNGVSMFCLLVIMCF